MRMVAATVPEVGTRAMAKVVSGDVPAWKTELSEKLVASRARRSGRGTMQPRLPLEHDPDEGRHGEAGRASVAAAVAARYAGQPSYREILEHEAAEAALAAEHALMEAQAAQEAVRRRMEDARAAEAAAAEARDAEEQLCAEQERAERESVAVRYDVDERTQRQMDAYEARRTARSFESSHQPAPAPLPRISDPLEEETVAPAVPLAANLIEFPRELVAPRKARPRLAEGPLRETESQPGQLRIFEVEPDAIDRRAASPEHNNSGLSSSSLAHAGLNSPGMNPSGPGVRATGAYGRGASGVGVAAAAGLDWSSIRLDSLRPEQAHRIAHPNAEEAPIKVARMEDRIMAALVDGALSFAGFLVFVFVFSSCTAHPPAGKGAAAGAVVALVTIFAAYQWIFFRFGESTPGMQYARIALCTLNDDNPTRRTMQRRVGALLLSALPLGLGLLWVVFDEDHLGWHDRISGTYQRSYK